MVCGFQVKNAMHSGHAGRRRDDQSRVLYHVTKFQALAARVVRACEKKRLWVSLLHLLCHKEDNRVAATDGCLCVGSFSLMVQRTAGVHLPEI